MRLDHIVWIVADLDRAQAAARALGFEVVAGGRHTGLGSRNALVPFADGSYLELASFAEPPDPPLPGIAAGTARRDAMRVLDAAGARRFEVRWLSQAGLEPGLSDLAFAPDAEAGRNLASSDAAASPGDRSTEVEPSGAAWVRRLRSRGLDLSEPLAMQRARPDGFTLSWRMVHPDGTDLPFLIDDVTPRSERVPSASVHPNGAAGIALVAVAVRDLALSVARWRALLGIEGVGAYDADGRRGHGFDVHGARILLVPVADHAGLADRVDRRGEGVYQVLLRRSEIPPSRTRGGDGSPSARESDATATSLHAGLATARDALGGADVRWADAS